MFDIFFVKSVVSASCEPDTFELAIEIKRNSFESDRTVVAVDRTTIGKKNVTVQMNDDGVHDVHTDDISQVASLNNDQVRLLGNICLKVSGQVHDSFV